MGKFKKNNTNSSPKIHLKQHKLKHKNKKLKKQQIESYLNQSHSNGTYSQTHGKHLQNREVSNVLKSFWDIDEIPQDDHLSVKIKKHNRNKNIRVEKLKQRSNADSFSKKQSRKCKDKHLNVSSWNVETTSNSSPDKKGKKRKCSRKMGHSNLSENCKPPHLMKKTLLCSILISDDSESQTEEDVPIETIVQHSTLSSTASNVNFVNFTTENVKKKCKSKKKQKGENRHSKRKLDESSDKSAETITIDDCSDSLNTSTSGSKNLKPKKCKKKRKKKKTKMNLPTTSTSYYDSEIEIIESTQGGTDTSRPEVSEIDTSRPEVSEIDTSGPSDGLEALSEYGGAFDVEGETSLEHCQYYVLENCCIAILKHPTKLYFNGVLKASAIVGKVDVLGFTLTHEPQVIHSLRGSSFLCFETIDTENREVSTEDLIKLGLNKSVIESLGPSDCILKLEPHSLAKVRFIDNYISQKLAPYWRVHNEMEKLLHCSFDFEHHVGSIFHRNPYWEEGIQSVINTQKSKSIICGGKSTGKSTLFRYTVNKLLSDYGAVICLDFDIGQSEFCVPGCISVVKVTSPLLGPNFTHLRKPDRSYFIGTVSVTNNLLGYIQAIKLLLDYCTTNPAYKKLPWVINTMGFVRGLGFEIMIHLTRMVQPTHIFQLSSYNRLNQYPHTLDKHFFDTARFTKEWTDSYVNDGVCHHELFVLNSIDKYYKKNKVVLDWQFQPREMRHMIMLSYLFDIVKNENQSLLDIQPYVASMKNARFISDNLNIIVNDALIPCIFNGSFVALCNEQIINDEKNYICEGFGIVRGIDKDDIYLLTPINLATLNNVTHILMGAEPLPPSVYINSKCVNTAVPYVSSSNRSQTNVAPRRATYNIIKKYIQNRRKNT